MKKTFKQLTTGLALMISAAAFSQVGINTPTPHASADLELASTNKTLYLNRVADPANDVADPQEGMVLYDTTMKCLRAYQGNPAEWSGCLAGGDGNGGLEGEVTNLNCAGAYFTPATAVVGQAYNGTLTIPYTGGNGGIYPAQNATVNGLTFDLPLGAFANGDGNVVYNVTGTPTAAGTTTISVTIGGQSCSGANAISLTVNNPAPNNPSGTGTLSGRTCFDVVEQFVSDACGTIASRISQKADFSQPPTNPQTYTFKPTGTVSNVRFVYMNTNGQVIQSITPDADYSGTLTSSQTATATVVFYNNLNTTAAGRSRDEALLGDIYVIYKSSADNTGPDFQVKLTLKVQDCPCCGAMTYANPDGTGGIVWQEFLCHNLGADITLDPHVPNVGINGAYIQWGRRGPNVTGDSRIDWQTAPNNGIMGFAAAPTAANANEGAISGWNNTAAYYDSWGSSKTAKDPCPVGYRVPTFGEWKGVNENNSMSATGTWTSGPTEYGSALHYGPDASTKLLTLPAAGARLGDGSLSLRGYLGYYWTSSAYTNADIAYIFTIYKAGGNPGGNQVRAQGTTIRCIEE